MGQKEINRNCPWGSPDIQLNRKYFKSTILNMFKSIYKEKESTRIMSHQIESINKKTGILKRNPREILDLKNTTTEI